MTSILGPVHTYPDIFETAYLVLLISVNRALNHSARERFQKYAVSVNGFTSFVSIRVKKNTVLKISGFEWTWRQ